METDWLFLYIEDKTKNTSNSMLKKYKNFLNEEVGLRNLKRIVKDHKSCEIYFHKDLDGVTSAIAMKEFLKTYYQIECVDSHIIQYGGLEYAVKNHQPGNIPVLVDFAHSKPMFTIATDHHDKQSGAEDTESTYFKSARSNVETISGEISYGEIFTQQDIELIKTVDSANFLKHNITPEDVQNSIFKYKREESAEKNRFMMGFVVNRLLLAYKNKRISVTSLDGKRDHVNRNILECLVLDSTASLYSMFSNIRHYINNARVSDRAGVLAKPEEIAKNLSNYIDRMKNYKFIEDPETGEATEFDPTNRKHQSILKTGSKISKGAHFDEEYKIISQYGGGSMIKPGSYDRYVPFKNYPEANFICIVWPMGLVQVSCNPFREKKLKNINLGEISKEVLAKHEPLLSRYYVTLEDVKREFESSQDWKKMQKEEGEGYEGVGFKFSDLEAFYSDCVYKKNNKEIEKVDIHDGDIREAMDTLYQDMDDETKGYLKKFKIAVWEIITRNSGGHPSITNIQGLNFLKYNKEMMKISYSTEKYTDVLKKIAREFVNNLKEKIDVVNKGEEVQYDTKGVELTGQDTNENYEYQLVDKETGKPNTVSKEDFIKAGAEKGMKTDRKSLMTIDHPNKKVIAKFEKFLSESTSSKWFIQWGLGGGFGGASNYEVISATSEEDAMKQAWNSACEEYDGMAGLHGLRSVEEIMENDEVDADEAQQIYDEERESWLDYSAEPYNPEKHDRLR